jgi:hypothetical protein
MKTPDFPFRHMNFAYVYYREQKCHNVFIVSLANAGAFIQKRPQRAPFAQPMEDYRQPIFLFIARPVIDILNISTKMLQSLCNNIKKMLKNIGFVQAISFGQTLFSSSSVMVME